jgi:hypothetical protein
VNIMGKQQVGQVRTSESVGVELAEAQRVLQAAQARVSEIARVADANVGYANRPNVSRADLLQALLDEAPMQKTATEAELRVEHLRAEREQLREREIEALTEETRAAVRPLLAKLAAALAGAVPVAEEVARLEHAHHRRTHQFLDASTFVPLVAPEAGESMFDYWRGALIARGLLDE